MSLKSISPVLIAALSMFAAVLTTVPATAQAGASPRPPEGSNWGRVQALPIDTGIQVNARTRHMVCTLTAVDADTLTCDHNVRFEIRKVTFQRAEIQTIKLTRRGRSAVLGAAFGAGAGAVAGSIEGIHSNYFAVRGAFAMIYAFAGAFAGAPVGYFTDFANSTVYKAP